MLKVLIGDMFNSKSKTLVNTVNCAGVMGKGVALEFKNRYPDMYKEYVQLCKEHKVRPGRPYYYHNLLGESIINFPTKDDWRSVSNIQYIIDGLEWFRNNYSVLGITSIAFPPLGCGNGGLLWEDVGPLMYKAMHDLPIDIEIYAPYGTKQEYLSVEFLSDYQAIKKRRGLRTQKFNPNWICILEIINRLNSNPCAALVGRTTYQKICYMSTLEGIDTGFQFKQGSYGPYSLAAKDAFIQMCNANLIKEIRKGQMDSIVIGDIYVKYKEKNIEIINKYSEKIAKLVDIFNRIKNTAQAEMYTTIIYAYHQLARQNTRISEKDILEYVLNWKPHWKGRIFEISNSIRAMSALGFVCAEFCYDMPGIHEG